MVLNEPLCFLELGLVLRTTTGKRLSCFHIKDAP